MRGDISVDETLLVQEHDRRFHASRVEAYRGLFDRELEAVGVRHGSRVGSPEIRVGVVSAVSAQCRAIED